MFKVPYGGNFGGGGSKLHVVWMSASESAAVTRGDFTFWLSLLLSHFAERNPKLNT